MNKLTLDEAIKHCDEVAEHNEALIKRGYAGGCNSHDCSERAENHRQLAEWLRELKERRATDVQPVKRGKWVKLAIVPATDTGNSILASCSVCGNTVTYTTIGREITLKYCPNCGAKMDGDVE